MVRSAPRRLVAAAGTAVVTLLSTACASSPTRVAAPSNPSARPWLNPRQSPEMRAAELVEAMSLSEKIAMVHGATTPSGAPASVYVGYVPPDPTLAIPALTLEDGPAGIADLMEGVTLFPAPLALGATFNRPLAAAYGRALGEEARGKGVDVLLAPTVNLDVNPLWGRDFETFGSDPLLTSVLSAAEIGGIQSEGVMATAKHLAVYSAEAGRMTGDEEVAPGELEQRYLPPFDVAAHDKVAAMMTSYEKLDGTFSSENAALLEGILTRQWHFHGMVMSDWFGTHSTRDAALAGLDLEMPDGQYFGDPLAADVSRGAVPVGQLNSMVTAIVTEMFRFGLFDRSDTGSPTAVVSTEAHRALSRQVAEAGAVLVKNRGSLLPLDASSLSSIAVIDPEVVLGGGTSFNPDNVAFPKMEGCGSAFVIPSGYSDPASSIQAEVGPSVPVVSVTTDDITAAVAAARSSAVAVVVLHDEGCEDIVEKTFEGSDVADRSSYALPGGQDALVAAVEAANPRTVVVLDTQGPVSMPWLNTTPALLEDWYPGQEDGAALTDLLFGVVDPSGRLPVALGTSPGLDFGAGLSYTSFHFSHEALDGEVTAGGASALSSLRVSVTVTNTGRRRGTAVAEVYAVTGSGNRTRRLAGFATVTLDPGRSARTSIALTPLAFSNWKARGMTEGSWKVAARSFRVVLGTSSADTSVLWGATVRSG